jgi:hypothetical protein
VIVCVFFFIIYLQFVGFEVLTAVVMKSYVFWDVPPCSPFKINRRFGGTCRLHLEGRRISQAGNQREAVSKQRLLAWLIS